MNGPVVPQPDRQVRLHFKVLENPWPATAVAPDTMAAYMREVYAPYGIDVIVAGPPETLGLEVLNDLFVDTCMLLSTTGEQDDLFGHRNNVPANEICIYFVRSTVDPAAGCASRANGRPAAVVTPDATAWTLGHECGHVLGLSHATPVDRVMVSGTWKIKVDPPVLGPPEVAAIKASPFIQQVGPGPAPPPPPAQPAPAGAGPGGGADAVRSKVARDDRADEIRTDLDQDDGIDYAALAQKLGPSAVDALARVVRESRPRIAAGAVNLAGMIDRGSGRHVVAEGAASEHPVVRVAAAATARRLPEEPATRLVLRLLEDRDVGVRGHAVRSAARVGTPELEARIRAIATEDPSPAVQQLAAGLLGERPRPAKKAR